MRITFLDYLNRPLLCTLIVVAYSIFGNTAAQGQEATFNQFKKEVSSFGCEIAVNIGNSLTDKPIKVKNTLSFIYTPNGKIYSENTRSSNLEQKIIDFLDNNGDGNCEYCKGRRKGDSSDNPNMAFIEITNYSTPNQEFYSKTGYSTEDVLQFEQRMSDEGIQKEIFLSTLRRAYGKLWLRMHNLTCGSRLNYREFLELGCEESKKISDTYFSPNILFLEEVNLSLPISVSSKTNNVPVVEEIDTTEYKIPKGTSIISFNDVDQKPTFLGCENVDNADCTANKIREYLLDQFDITLMQDAGINGKLSALFQFTINTDGDIEDIRVRGSHNSLDKPLIKIISELPRFIPGTHNGERVEVKFRDRIWINDTH